MASLEDGITYDIIFDPPPEPAAECGVYWIITTCLTGIALGLGLGALLWLVLS